MQPNAKGVNLITEVLQSKLHNHTQGYFPVAQSLYQSCKIKQLLVFVVTLRSRFHLGYDRLCKTSVIYKRFKH